MPGSGVNAGNIFELAAMTGASEFHASAKHTHKSGMRWRPELLRDMQGGELQSDVEQIRNMVAALR
jgi:copper homeostasis protein